MKIAVTAKGSGLGAWLDPIFEESRQLVLVSEEGRFESWGQDGASWPDPLGAARVAWLVRQGAGALVTGKLSGEARNRLAVAGIILFTAENGSVLELVEAAREGRLTRLA